MTQSTQREKLKRHFARRATTQARSVLAQYKQCTHQHWKNCDSNQELMVQADKLTHYAERFSLPNLKELGHQISSHLKLSIDPHLPNQATQIALEECSQSLSLMIKRRSDDQESNDILDRTFAKPPIYLALNDHQFSQGLSDQLRFFGFRSIAFRHPNEFSDALMHSQIETVVADVDFGGERCGLDVIKAIQNTKTRKFPVIFISAKDDSLDLRLATSRAGGEEFCFQPSDPGPLVDKIEKYSQSDGSEPYRVLIIDDSKSQAKYIENILNRAQMLALAESDPTQALERIKTFQPEIILLDMYMPVCSGMELARVIRQQALHHQPPIIYLSAEEDLTKQIHAMSNGGDDFLTKPVAPQHLVSTIQNRARRARAMRAVRTHDNLTGLHNHTHTMQRLSLEIETVKNTNLPLTFALLDIDNFRDINHRYTHMGGDQVLKSLALFLKQRLRKSDHIGRYNGARFAIILPDTNETEAKIMLNEIRERFAQLEQHYCGEGFFALFSAGVTNFDGESLKTFCERTEKALSTAKRSGRNTVQTSK